MSKFQCNPNIEVSGQQALAFFNNIRSTEIRPVMTKYGLTDIQPGDWYPVQSLLDVLSDLSEKPDWSANFVSIGMAMADAAPLPPEARGAPAEAFLMGLSAGYKAGHRGGETGAFEVQKVGENHFRLINEITTAYPDDVVYGLVYGFMRRLLPKGAPLTVRYDDSSGPRRDNGGSYTVLDILWG